MPVELGPRRIAVNSVAPGGVLIDFGGDYLRDPQLQQAVVAETRLRRVG